MDGGVLRDGGDRGAGGDRVTVEDGGGRVDGLALRGDGGDLDGSRERDSAGGACGRAVVVAEVAGGSLEDDLVDGGDRVVGGDDALG